MTDTSKIHGLWICGNFDPLENLIKSFLITKNNKSFQEEYVLQLSHWNY